MEKIVLLFVLFSCGVYVSSTGSKPACAYSAKYAKNSPSPEPDLHECKAYSCNSCCLPNITTQLAINPLQQVGNINYNQCPPSHLSPQCSMESTYFNCFYQCSPNLYPWITETGLFKHIPICADFCNRLFHSCQSDLSCVVGKGNWITGLNPSNKENPCVAGASCRNYTEIYQNGSNLCNNIFGSLFLYSTDVNTCVDPSDPTHNAEIVAGLKAGNEVAKCETFEDVPYTDTGMIVGIVFGVLGGIFLIVAGVAYYMRSKKAKDASPKPTPKPTEEMATLRATNNDDNEANRDSD